MPTLAELIQERIDHDHASIRGLARETDGRLEHQTIDRWYRRAMTQFPRDADTFEAFAGILRTSVEYVVLAMAAQLGVPVRQIGTAPPLPGLDALTGPQLTALRALVRVIPAEPEHAPRELTIAADKRPAPSPSPRRRGGRK